MITLKPGDKVLWVGVGHKGVILYHNERNAIVQFKDFHLSWKLRNNIEPHIYNETIKHDKNGYGYWVSIRQLVLIGPRPMEDQIAEYCLYDTPMDGPNV